MTRHSGVVNAVLLAVALLAEGANAANGDRAGAGSRPPRDAPPVLRLSDGPGSATCSLFDFATGLAWRHRLGDWRDATGARQGEKPFAEASVPDVDQRQPVEWNVTDLVRAWARDPDTNHGLLLRVPPGSRGGNGTAFHSRETRDPSLRPVLVIKRDDGRSEEMQAVADTELNCATYRPLGARPTFQVSRNTRAALRFEGAFGQVKEASLRLTTTDRQYGPTRIGVYRLDPPTASPAAATWTGLASGRADDAGLASDPAVILVEGFEEREWTRRWSYVSSGRTWERVTRADELGFEPIAGHALKTRILKGQHYGLDVRYNFADRLGAEPEEIYFRYYLRLGSDFRPTRDGGKLPGIAGTYNRAGWGGRRSDGTNGWSLRGGFGLVVPVGHPLAGRVPVHTYAYHARMKGDYGELWPWSIDRPGVLEPGRWYCIEQHVRMNTPGEPDGVMRAWIDGVRVLERNDLTLRNVEALRIENVWLDVYHGGTSVSPYDQHLFLDGVVIARKPIGCWQRPAGAS